MNKKLKLFSLSAISLYTMISYASYNVVITKEKNNYKSALSWLEWVNIGSEYDCGIPSPLPSTVNLDEEFTSSYSCKQDQKRENLNQTKSETRVFSMAHESIGIGTMNYDTGTQRVELTEWVDLGINYDCGVFSPLASSVNLGESFIQNRDCSLRQSREETIYNIWADNSEVIDSITTESQTISKKEFQASSGIKNYKTGLFTKEYTEWIDNGIHYNCEAWSGMPEGILYDTAYISTRWCSQNQDRTETIYDQWADGTQIFLSSYVELKTVSELESQTLKSEIYVNKSTLIGSSYINRESVFNPSNIFTNFTMEVWVKPQKTVKLGNVTTNIGASGTSGENYIFRAEHGGAYPSLIHGMGLSVGTNAIKVYVHSGSYMPPVFVKYMPVSSTNWTHISVSVNGNVPSVYVNGIFIGTGVAPSSGNAFTPENIGDRSSYGNINADVSIARIWDNTLTASEINNNYNKYLRVNTELSSSKLVIVSEQVNP